MTDAHLSSAGVAVAAAVDALEKVVAQLRSLRPEQFEQERTMSAEDALAQEIPKLAESLDRLTGVVSADNDKRDRQVRVLMGIMGVLVLVLLTVVSLQREFLHGRSSSREAVKNTAQIVQVIRDCTDPAGKCYQSGQAQQTAANAALVRQIEAAYKEVAHCRYRPEVEFNACVDKAFAKLGPK